MRDKSAGNADLAIEQFQNYLKWFGSTDLAPNAQYYIGEIKYLRGDLDGALMAFEEHPPAPGVHPRVSGAFGKRLAVDGGNAIGRVVKGAAPKSTQNCVTHVCAMQSLKLRANSAPRLTFVKASTPAKIFGGGGGLVSTAADYQRFVQMLCNGGELDGVRILSPRSVKYMASNHLPNNADLTAFGRPLFSETTFDGVGFGLGVSVTIDPVKGRVPGNAGEFAWGGAASTAFWVDPVDDLTVTFFTQLLPSSVHPIRSQLKQLVYQALID